MSRPASALFCAWVAAWFLALGVIPAAHAQQNQNFDNVEIHVLPIQNNVYMLVGAGGNITVQAGKQGVLLVDTQYAQLSDKIYAAIRKISDQPLRYIINTHVHPDHTGGNEKLGKLGSTIAGGNVSGTISDASEGAAILAHENVLKRMSVAAPGQPALPSGMLPTDTYYTNEKDIFFNGEGIQLIHQPAAHTDGDTIVFFRRSDVIATGDLFTPGGYPVVDLQRGGNIQGVIAALNRIIQLAIPAEKQEGGTMIVPGHGRLCDQADVVEYRDMATIIRDRVQDMVKKGMTLEQVKAAKPTADWDPRYGPGDRFVEGIYRSLTQKKQIGKVSN